jgi:hypothetical protein
MFTYYNSFYGGNGGASDGGGAYGGVAVSGDSILLTVRSVKLILRIIVL